MTQAEKLEALVQYVREHGFRWDGADILNFTVKFKKSFLPIYFELSSTYTWEETDDFGDKTGVVHVENNAQALSVQELIFNHDFARALFGEEKKKWLGKFSWYSLYEQDGYTFQSAQELIDSWVYQGGGPKPTIAELESLPTEGIKVCAGVVEKLIETTNKGFGYHLQQAVISDDPIGYMYKEVFGEL